MYRRTFIKRTLSAAISVAVASCTSKPRPEPEPTKHKGIDSLQVESSGTIGAAIPVRIKGVALVDGELKEVEEVLTIPESGECVVSAYHWNHLG